MYEPDRLTLDLKIQELGWGFYLLEAFSEQIGRMQSKMALAPDDSRLRGFLEAIRARRAGESEVRRLGGQLYEALLGSLGDFWFSFRERAVAGMQPALVRLVVEPPELLDLPWEMMFDEQGQPLVSYLSLVRYQAVPALPRRTVMVTHPLRLLLASASPADYPPVNVKRNLELVQEGLRPVELIGQVRTSLMDHVSLKRLHKTLQGEATQLFHFIGYLMSEPTSKAAWTDGGLVFEDDWDASEVVTGDQMASLFTSLKDLQVVVLGTDVLFPAMLPAALVRQAGVPVVLSYQFAGRGAERDFPAFWREFYGRLSAGVSVDLALFAARQELLQRSKGRMPEWAGPTLTMCGDGVTFAARQNHSAVKSMDETFVIRGPERTRGTREALKSDLKVLVRRKQEMEKQIQSFWGGVEHAPRDQSDKLRSLAKQIGDLEEQLYE